MSINKATVIFTDNNDGGLEAQLVFEGGEANKDSNAHIAAVLAYKHITETLSEEDGNESAE